jgi:hypothetical protein
VELSGAPRARPSNFERDLVLHGHVLTLAKQGEARHASDRLVVSKFCCLRSEDRCLMLRTVRSPTSD